MQWTYLYRAVDKAAVTAFFNKSIACNRLSHTVTMDKCGANKADIELHHMLRKKQPQDSANLSIFEQFSQLAA